MKRPRRFSLSQQFESPPAIELDHTDLPQYLTKRLREVMELILRLRPDASIEITEGYLNEAGFYILATIDVKDIAEFRSIRDAYGGLLDVIHWDEDLPIFIELLPKDTEKAWGDTDGAKSKAVQS